MCAHVVWGGYANKDFSLIAWYMQPNYLFRVIILLYMLKQLTNASWLTCYDKVLKYLYSCIYWCCYTPMRRTTWMFSVAHWPTLLASSTISIRQQWRIQPAPSNASLIWRSELTEGSVQLHLKRKLAGAHKLADSKQTLWLSQQGCSMNRTITTQLTKKSSQPSLCVYKMSILNASPMRLR